MSPKQTRQREKWDPRGAGSQAHSTLIMTKSWELAGSFSQSLISLNAVERSGASAEQPVLYGNANTEQFV